jgi:hypothetical protein
MSEMSTINECSNEGSNESIEDLLPEDIHIDVDRTKGIPRSESRDNSQRSEECWTGVNEGFLLSIQDDCDKASKQHQCQARLAKKINICISIPTFTIPLVLINLSIFTAFVYIQPIALTIVAILNGAMATQNWAGKYEVHQKYSGKYADLSDDIDKIMIRKKRHRESFDVILERITLKMLFLNDSAPDV